MEGSSVHAVGFTFRIVKHQLTSSAFRYEQASCGNSKIYFGEASGAPIERLQARAVPVESVRP